MSILRALLEKSWRTKQRRMALGDVTRNHASEAGRYLEAADGDAEIAISILPNDSDPFWSVVRTYLELLIDQEREEDDPNLKTGT